LSLAEVESHPFELDTMLFMDWRDDHLGGSPEMRVANEKTPTFLYAMPFTKNKVCSLGLKIRKLLNYQGV
jgi:lycopene beta-cyclase